MSDHDDAAYFADGGRLAHTDWEPDPSPRPEDPLMSQSDLAQAAVDAHAQFAGEPRPDDLAAVRAATRRMLAVMNSAPESELQRAKAAVADFVASHPALLADPAPEGLSEEERRFAESLSEGGWASGSDDHARQRLRRAGVILRRLSGSGEHHDG